MNSFYEIEKETDHLFRRESGKMVSVLAKIFGLQHLDMVEDVVQDALVKALESWKYNGIPEQPKAWLYRVAKNRAIDILRKNRFTENFDFSHAENPLFQSGFTIAASVEQSWSEEHIRDDFLGMIYASCHPEINTENQIAFILKTLCGFSTKEIAKSFITNEQTIAKRIYRTKTYFKKHKIRPQIPEVNQLKKRNEAVLSVIYLLFNEGYSSTYSEELIRKDLISQALFLGRSLINNAKTSSGSAFALMALMCFHVARIESRTDKDGKIVLLKDQNRSLWDHEIINAGITYLHRAISYNSSSSYHLEALILYEHCIAKKFEDTNWDNILKHYDTILSHSFDPVIYLNRCLAVLERSGPEEALIALRSLDGNKEIEKYYLYHAALGEIYVQLGKNEPALNHIQMARELTLSQVERDLLLKRMGNLK